MMSSDVTEMLFECNQRVSAVFPNREAFFPSYRGTFYTKYGMQKLFREIIKETGIAKNNGHNPRLYDFRHTFATHRLYQWMNEDRNYRVAVETGNIAEAGRIGNMYTEQAKESVYAAMVYA